MSTFVTDLAPASSAAEGDLERLTPGNHATCGHCGSTTKEVEE